MFGGMAKNDRVTVSASAFETGYADLKPGPVKVLDTLAARIKNTAHVLDIEGHTADDASDAYNQDLSLRRAEAVKCYLHGKGVDPHRMRTIGRGAAMPVASNSTAAGRELNRRVEVIIRRG
jgi:OmpA-OmpF porin, OOP family